MKEKKGGTGQAVNASSAQIPKEIIYFFRRYFLSEQEKPDTETVARAELLSKVLIRVMLQLYQFGMEDEFQPVFVATSYVRPHAGGVTGFKRAYEAISGEPFVKFNLSLFAQKYETAYKEWFEETFGVELNEEAAEVLQQWSDVLK